MFIYLGQIASIVENLENLVADDALVQAKLAHLKGARRQSSLAGRCLLKYALVEQGYLAATQDIPLLHFNNLGKPAFADNRCSFSISHSGDFVAVALGQGDLGIDLELFKKQRAYPDRLLRHTFNALEIAEYEKRSPEDQIDFFLQQWTVREALLKAAGSSIFEMKKLQIDPQKLNVYTELTHDGLLAIYDLSALPFPELAHRGFLSCFSENRAMGLQLFHDNCFKNISLTNIDCALYHVYKKAKNPLK